MRRRAGLILLALAVFFTALSPLVRWYVFPHLAKIPANQYQDMVLEAKDATLLDYATMTARTVPKVTIVQTLKGDVEASEAIEKNTGRTSSSGTACPMSRARTGRWSPGSPSATSSTPTPRNPCTPRARWSTATP